VVGGQGRVQEGARAAERNPARGVVQLNKGGRMAFGELPEIPVGTSFISRRALFDRGVHRQLQAGIAGGEHPGTEIDCRLWRLRGRRRLRQRWPHEEPCRRASSSRSPRRASTLRFRAGDERRPSGTQSPGRTLVGPEQQRAGFRCGQVPLRSAFLHRAALRCRLIPAQP